VITHGHLTVHPATLTSPMACKGANICCPKPTNAINTEEEFGPRVRVYAEL
jgi:hypothetical protein